MQCRNLLMVVLALLAAVANADDQHIWNVPASGKFDIRETRGTNWTSEILDLTFNQNPSNFPAWTVLDGSQHRGDGTQTTPRYRPSWNGGTLTFDGVSNTVLLAAIGGGTTFTITFWAKPTNPALTAYLFDSSSGRFIIGMPAYTSSYGWGFYDGTFKIFGPMPDATWHHFAFTFNAAGTNAEGWLDGVKSSSNQSYAAKSLIGTCRLGSHYSGTSSYYTGGMDDFRIYSRILSGAEITNIYNANKSPTPARPR